MFVIACLVSGQAMIFLFNFPEMNLPDK